MVEKVLYLSDTNKYLLNNISAVICANREIALFYKDKCIVNNIAVLVENDILAYDSLGLDGIYFSNNITVSDFTKIRKRYKDAQIGKNCFVSRHLAMIYAELGADFVLFSGDSSSVIKITNWWGTIIEVASVVVGCDIVPEKADFEMIIA